MRKLHLFSLFGDKYCRQILKSNLFICFNIKIKKFGRVFTEKMIKFS
jgi:hypothetical protein